MQGSLYHNGGRRIVGGHGRIKHDVCLLQLDLGGACTYAALHSPIGGDACTCILFVLHSVPLVFTDVETINSLKFKVPSLFRS